MRLRALLTSPAYPDFSLLREWERSERQERVTAARAHVGQRPPADPCHSHNGRPQPVQLLACSSAHHVHVPGRGITRRVRCGLRFPCPMIITPGAAAGRPGGFLRLAAGLAACCPLRGSSQPPGPGRRERRPGRG